LPNKISIKAAKHFQVSVPNGFETFSVISIQKFFIFFLQNLILTQEARSARTLRDELDVLRERANKVLNLEAELQSYKDKIGQMESLKSR